MRITTKERRKNTTTIRLTLAADSHKTSLSRVASAHVRLRSRDLWSARRIEETGERQWRPDPPLKQSSGATHGEIKLIAHDDDQGATSMDPSTASQLASGLPIDGGALTIR